MTDTVLLRHFALSEQQFGKYDACQDVFAFREFGPEDSEELKQEVGIECDRDAFEERIQGDSNYKALVYQVNPTRVLHYIFGTRDDMQCTYDDSTQTYYSQEENYYVSSYHSTANSLYTLDELEALQYQFEHTAARQLCKFKGLLHHAMPTDKILLQFLKPEQHAFRSLDCTDTYAFREYYSGLDHELLRHGAYCDRAKYLEIFHGHTHYHAIVYYKSSVIDKKYVYNIIEYVFASFKSMNCQALMHTPEIYWHSDPKRRYTNNNRPLRTKFLSYFSSEKDAITDQFSIHEARIICKTSGLLTSDGWRHNSVIEKTNNISVVMQDCYDCPAHANTTLLMEYTTAMFNNTQVDTIPYSSVVNTTLLMNTTSTVTVSEMELLTSAASLLLASPLVLVPAMLVIHNVCDMFFDGLSNWLTNLGRSN